MNFWGKWKQVRRMVGGIVRLYIVLGRREGAACNFLLWWMIWWSVGYRRKKPQQRLQLDQLGSAKSLMRSSAWPFVSQFAFPLFSSCVIVYVPNNLEFLIQIDVLAKIDSDGSNLFWGALKHLEDSSSWHYVISDSINPQTIEFSDSSLLADILSNCTFFLILNSPLL